ncbi:TPA: hypothetical protein ACGTQP_001268 [Salmonella enterica]|nr:hypothetical protein [Salmonella enterica subsp. enterica serovar Enteritidis]
MFKKPGCGDVSDGAYGAIALMAVFADFIMYSMPGQGCAKSDTFKTTAFLLFVLPVL